MTDQASEATAVVTSPYGRVSLHVHGSSGVTVRVNRIDALDLPQGMAVDGVVLMAVGISTSVDPKSPLILDVSLNHEGDPESGEWLDSAAFRTDEGILQVAMRDNEWLGSKGIVAEPVEYKLQGLRQVILEAAAGTSLCISMAWKVGDRTATEGDLSTWFAVDRALPD